MPTSTDPTTPPSSPDGAALVRVVSCVNGESRRSEGIDALREALADPEAHVWVDVTSSAPEHVEPVARLLELHPLIAEDIAERNQRAKVEEIEGTIHVVLFWIAYRGEVSEVVVDMVVEKWGLLSVHESGSGPVQ